MTIGVLFSKKPAPAEITRKQKDEQPPLSAARSHKVRPSTTPTDSHNSDKCAQNSRVKLLQQLKVLSKVQSELNQFMKTS